MPVVARACAGGVDAVVIRFNNSRIFPITRELSNNYRIMFNSAYRHILRRVEFAEILWFLDFLSKVQHQLPEVVTDKNLMG
jgi:hypothetical protein